MHVPTFTHLDDSVLIQTLDEAVSPERSSTAMVIALIAEVDERGLFLPAGYESMIAFCMEKLRFSKDAAYKRIQAARAVRKFSILFAPLTDGRLCLATVGLLAPHLTPGNVDELVAAALGRSKSEVEQMLASRFPRTELIPLVEAISSPEPSTQLAPGQVAGNEAGIGGDRMTRSGPFELAPGQVEVRNEVVAH